MSAVKKVISVLALAGLLFSLAGCEMGAKDSGDPDYEAQTIVFEEFAGEESEKTEVSVEALRALPQYDLSASYQRTTGLTEEFEMRGPYLSEVMESIGLNLADYAGIGVMGSDGYYCLLSKEVIEATPDLMLALIVDGEAKLDEENAPARLAVQGQLGPYWVKRVEKIILYESIPEKNITSVWMFRPLIAGIEPYLYEYYGSKDASVELAQIFSRFDQVDSKAFFTMKSSDGFKKNEAISVVKSRYYIKYEGVDAPTNISPYIKLGMNVNNIAWFSTNADAVLFPEKLDEYMAIEEIGGKTGVTLQEALYEVGLDAVKTESFDLLGTKGEKITVKGQDMNKGILLPNLDGTTSVIWEKEAGYTDLPDLLRIRLVADPSLTSGGAVTVNPLNGEEIRPPFGSAVANEETILSVSGDGMEQNLFLSLEDLRSLKKGYLEEVYSTVNNWPVKKFAVGKGVDLTYLLKHGGIKDSAELIRVESADGYFAELTRKQLFGNRYCYLNLLSGSVAGAKEVKPMLAWAYENGSKNLSEAKEGELRLLIGQLGLSDVNTAPSVQHVTKIIVSVSAPGSWEKVSVTEEDDLLTLSHPKMDQVKLHYTLDGSEPTIDSPVYNPSTSYFQPNLIKPLSVKGTGTLKVKAVGFGKKDSEVTIYAYE
ncbi:MAG: chitobiase/beta-hexosaminidase C-terminal domain-containing protein [Eubacteriales bacterium]|nr:chitobiase/beta-hexosaminidase C-terminal domain-containing protein [Eubacteriales bacterium]